MKKLKKLEDSYCLGNRTNPLIFTTKIYPRIYRTLQNLTKIKQHTRKHKNFRKRATMVVIQKLPRVKGLISLGLLNGGCLYRHCTNADVQLYFKNGPPSVGDELIVQNGFLALFVNTVGMTLDNTFSGYSNWSLLINEPIKECYLGPLSQIPSENEAFAIEGNKYRIIGVFNDRRDCLKNGRNVLTKNNIIKYINRQ